MKTHIEIYRGKDRDWHWRAKRAGRIVCDGSEGYKCHAGLLKSTGPLSQH